MLTVANPRRAVCVAIVAFLGRAIVGRAIAGETIATFAEPRGIRERLRGGAVGLKLVPRRESSVWLREGEGDGAVGLKRGPIQLAPIQRIPKLPVHLECSVWLCNR